MTDADEQEPALLPSASVLSQAKSMFKKSQKADNNPIFSLQVMKNGKYRYTIHNIGVSPVFVHYWTNSQLNLYRMYARKSEHTTIFIDATGGGIKCILQPDNTKSAHIFLYKCVIKTDYNGQYSQFAVSQMVTERQTANDIPYWLLEWKRTGAPPPHEAVCDASKALIIALINAFTNCQTIAEYADACKNGPMPKCFIRTDVAHTMKIYSDKLRNKHSGIRNRLLRGIGLLIVANDFDSAENNLKLLLTICRNPHQSPTSFASTAKLTLKTFSWLSQKQICF